MSCNIHMTLYSRSALPIFRIMAFTLKKSVAHMTWFPPKNGSIFPPIVTSFSSTNTYSTKQIITQLQMFMEAFLSLALGFLDEYYFLAIKLLSHVVFVAISYRSSFMHFKQVINLIHFLITHILFIFQIMGHFSCIKLMVSQSP